MMNGKRFMDVIDIDNRALKSRFLRYLAEDIRDHLRQ